MDHLSSELSKLKIDLSQRSDAPSSRKGAAAAGIAISFVHAGEHKNDRDDRCCGSFSR